ncbi:MAG TPA: mechanosensitive ion channel family protein [Candidatus Eisenbacteria bacterium]|nr:mechanosensitive ion channel family protein [Candidatus Eisenbacteria bacterium]
MTFSDRDLRNVPILFLICVLLLFSGTTWSQSASPKKAPTTNPLSAAPTVAQSEPPKDVLGRETPRGAVMGFLTAARKGNGEVAALYLNTPLRGEDAQVLWRQLAAVLNQRLPARINLISDKPEGSVPDPLKPDQDIVGTIETADGELDIVVERVDRGKLGKVWLFSGKTLASIPKVFQELNAPAAEEFLPKFIVDTRVFGVPVFQWLGLFLGLPLLYLATGLVGRIFSWGAGELIRRLTRNSNLKNPQLMRVPVRLLLVALGIYLVTRGVSLPLLARQFWLTFALMIVVIACVWFLLLLNRSAEIYLVKRRPSMSGSESVVRLFRRTIDGLLIFGGLLFVLYHFGIQLTAALAGLGVGGIAVALAAQKTLENIIGGVSLIADQAVRVGDFINLGDVQGTVEDVGLRSTRIRTLDRTVISLPNGQVAGMRLETISLRDKFWFHPIIGLRYETTVAQLRSVLNGIRAFLGQHPNLEPSSIRVRFIRLGAYSLDVEVFAYAFAHDWSNFLEIQEEILFTIIDIVQKAGTALAFPSQNLYLADDSAKRLLRWPETSDKDSNAETLGDEELVSRKR